MDGEAALRAHANSIEQELAVKVDRIAELEEEVVKGGEALRNCETELRRLSQRLALVARERDGLRDVLHSYQQSEQPQEHLAGLESALREYQVQLAVADQALQQQQQQQRAALATEARQITEGRKSVSGADRDTQ